MSTPYRTSEAPDGEIAAETFVYAPSTTANRFFRWLGGEENDVVLRASSHAIALAGRDIAYAEIVAIALEHRTKPYATSWTNSISGYQPHRYNHLDGTLDTARIVLELASCEAVPLTESYFEGEETAQWMGKIRVWLRSHGWQPNDEGTQ